MSRRNRGAVVALAMTAGLIVTEVVLNLLRGPEGMVQIENAGAEPIEGLVLTFGGRRTAVPQVAPGATARVFINGRGTDTLQLSFRQRGNPLNGYQTQGFDPELLQRGGFKLVLRIRPNEVVRYQDDAGAATPLGRAVQNLWQWFLKGLGVKPDLSVE